jgi:sugar lactone lactonase YvrE
MRNILAATLLAGLCGSAMAQPATTITMADPNTFPENVTVLGDGTVVIGAMLTHYIYRARPGQAIAERWIDLTSVGSASWGLMADNSRNTLWVCTAAFPLPAKVTPAIKERITTLRAFDTRTGAAKGAWPLRNPTNSCNDMTIAADGTVYASDIANGEIQRLKPGTAALETWLKVPELANVDGVAFVGSTLYANNVQTNKLFRIPLNADGSAGTPVEIALSQPLNGPDGMRAQNGKMYVAENRANQVSEITFNGDSGTVRVLKGGYVTATGVQPAGDVIWVQESKQNYWRDPALANADPNPFRIYAIPTPK